jgi:hypothetical protein
MAHGESVQPLQCKTGIAAMLMDMSGPKNSYNNGTLNVVDNL